MGIDDVFTAHKILPFDKLVRLEQCKLGYKLCNNLLPINLAKNMKQDHRYPTRSKKIPNLPQVSDSRYHSSFLFRAIKEYSNLNVCLRETNNLPTFNQRCKRQFMTEK